VKVSVAIPAYNGEAFIAEAVKSVLAQTYQDFELLVVDDRSTDATMDIVRGFSDPRISIAQNEDRMGIPANWNRCLTLATGELVCVFHQDDVMLPQNLEAKMSQFAADPGLSLVHSGAELLVESSTPTPPADWIERASEDFTVEGLEYFYKLLFRGNVICAPTVIARRQQLLDLGGFDEELGFTSDYEMWLKLCLQGKVSFLSRPLLRYRWHSRNASHDFRYERGVDESLLAAQRAVDYFVEKTNRPTDGAILKSAITGIARHRRWSVELEQAKTYLETELKSWKSTSAELERAKVWVENDLRNWQKNWSELEAQGKRREKEFQDNRSWLENELEKWQKNCSELEAENKRREKDYQDNRSWLENEIKNWQKTCADHEKMLSDQEKMILEQKAWIHELETGKDWLAGQNEFWRQRAEEMQARIEAKLYHVEKRFSILLVILLAAILLFNPLLLFILGSKLGILK
jgi:glycosyltransferase involved in cell wall biosynthesis